MSSIPIDPDEFEQVMRQVEQISRHELHLDRLEAGYRKMASIWLLTGLIACGLIVKSKATIPFDAWYLIIAICGFSSIGIGVLWMLDVKVYHNMANVYRIEGIRLERTHSWLRQVRSRAALAQLTGETARKVQLFYFISIVLFLLVIGIAFCNLTVWENNFFNKWLACIGLAAISVFLLIRMRWPGRNSYKELADPEPAHTHFSSPSNSSGFFHP